MCEIRSLAAGARRRGDKTRRRAPRSGPWRKDDQHRSSVPRSRRSFSGYRPLAIHAQVVGPAAVPPPPDFPAQGKPTMVKRADILEYRALASYSEPDWVTEQFVDAGKLPPVAERLPKEPLVYKTGNMPDGVGVYGDVMRHVIGGRPEGWNYMRRPDPGLGRHRHRHLRVPDPHRAALHGRAGGPRAAAEPREELGLVGGRQGADDPPDRGRQVVGRRPVRRRGRDVLLGRPRDRPGADAAERRLAGDLRRRHDARQGRRLHGEVHLHRRPSPSRCSTRSPTAPSARGRAT